VRDWSDYREIADAGGRMPFNAAAIRSMLDEIDRLRAERDDARRLAVHLEGLLAREQAKVRSAEILTGSYEGDRDRAFQRLSSCAAEMGAYRQQRDEVVAVLVGVLNAVDRRRGSAPVVDVEAVLDAADAFSERYARPAPAIIEP
jgi:hypothetical protein